MALRPWRADAQCEGRWASWVLALSRAALRLSTGRCKAIVDPDVAPLRPSEPVKPLLECRKSCFQTWIILSEPHQHPDAPHRRLLRASRERPRSHAAEQRDELASFHSITSSAATSSLSGTVRPSILAVEALITSSNLLDCTRWRSAGFAPLRMRPV